MSIRPRLLFAAVTVAAIALLPLPRGFDVFDTSIYIVEEEVTQAEDAYALSQNAVIEGLVDGDLVVAANRVTISGRVAGDLLVASDGTVTISGTVDGAVRGVARTVIVEPEGMIGDDLAVAAVTTRVRGSVGRDAIVFGGKFELSGSLGRDLHGRFIEGDIDGSIGRTADISIRRLELGPGARVDGNLLYRSNREAKIDDAAAVAGTLKQLSPRPSFFVDVWWTLATVIGFLAFLFTGFAVFLVMRRTSASAVRTVLERPLRTFAFGLGAIVLLPVLIVLFVVSLVGIPVAILLGVLYLLAFFFGPIPAVAAGGIKLTRGRLGIFSAFLLGAVLWRLGIAVLSFVAGGLYALALIWGVGGFVAAVVDGRRRPSAGERASSAPG